MKFNHFLRTTAVAVAITASVVTVSAAAPPLPGVTLAGPERCC